MGQAGHIAADPLPVDAYLDVIASELRRARALVVTASPGAGKTTRIPPALTADGPVILLQPRRIAARAIAARIAVERGWTLGREVGWQVRYEHRYGPDTRLLVVTEGILTARLQSDPLLSAFTTIVLDEFHERSVHADVAIALAREAWRARAGDDALRLVVMSATLDAEPVAAFLDRCPVIDIPGRLHPITVDYAPRQPIADAVRDLLPQTDGDLLCFLPGAGEIRRAIADIQPVAGDAIDVLPLHGSLSADDQALALVKRSRRRIVVATNIAETSLTVPGVSAVIDTGLHKIARYDADRAIDSLGTERITVDAAEQRAGRAGRERPGVVRRLWDARDRLRPHREPEIHRVDLSSTLLNVIAWGGDPKQMAWFDRPRDDAIDAAVQLLERLELIEASATRGWIMTAVGARALRGGLHPRLARMLVAANGAPDMARACAILSERHLAAAGSATTSSDLLSALDRWNAMPPHVHQAARAIAATFSQPSAPSSRSPASGLQPPRDREAAFLRAVLAGYPDRVAQRRASGSDRVLLTSGTGAILGRESGVREGEFLVALDVHASSPNDPIIRMASRVERDWLAPTSSQVEHRFDEGSGRVRAARIDRYDALILGEHPVAVDDEHAAELLAAAWLRRGPDEHDERWLRRVRFAGRPVDVAALVRDAARGARSLTDVHLARAFSDHESRELARDAPERLDVPSGRTVALEYHDDGSISASVKLQELFGLAETPRIGRNRVPVRFALLAPNGRPVQTTQDLRSFWERTYPEVRKELRGRYPKHPWPEDPWKATPSARPLRKPR